MRRAPVLPRTSAAGERPGPSRRPSVAPAADVVRRSATAGSSGPPSAGATPSPVTAADTVSAASLADQLSREGATVRRAIGSHRTATPSAPSTSNPTPGGVPGGAAVTTNARPAASTAPAGMDLGEQFEHILELLEARILRELERRGGRFRGGF
jgi:hypothetical protein